MCSGDQPVLARGGGFPARRGLTESAVTFILVGMLSPRRRDPDRTRERLLDAGFFEIYRHGFQAAGLDTIVDRAEVTKGALYHHFPSKHALGYAVLEEVIARFTDRRWIDPLSSPADPVAAIVESM